MFVQTDWAGINDCAKQSELACSSSASVLVVASPSAVVSDEPAAVFSIETPSADPELDIVLDMVADGIRVDSVSLELRQCHCGRVGSIARSIQGLSSL